MHRCFQEKKFIHARDQDDFKKVLAQIPTVSATDVQRVAQAHLRPEAMLVVTVGDAAKIEDELRNLNIGPVIALVFARIAPMEMCSPLKQDKTPTRGLVLAAAALQIKVIDHLVVSTAAVFSFRKEGLL